MAVNKNAFGNLMGALGGAWRPEDLQNQAGQIQRAYENQARLFHATGTTTISNAVITINPQTYTVEATYTNPPKPKTGMYRRVRREGEIRYSDSPMKWLDERVEEMQFVL